MTDSVALDRPCGHYWTDSDGLSRYSFPLDVPRGIGTDNEPAISLEYIQSGGNGILGLGWVLSTHSSIRRVPATIARGATRPILDVDRRQEHLSLDGQELLNITGEYHAASTTYTTQLGQKIDVVASSTPNEGFVSTDRSGRRRTYGTSSSSQRTANVAGTTQVREWYLERNTDVYGNYQSFTYNNTPVSQVAQLEEGVNYLESIHFTSNDKAAYTGRWRVDFSYKKRDDLVVLTNGHDRSTLGCLLERVDFVVLDANGNAMHAMKSYEIRYSDSASSGAALLTSILEKDAQGNQLTPSAFTYGRNYALAQPEGLFVPDKAAATVLPSQEKIAAVLPVNVSGRSLCDVVAVRHSASTGVMSLKTWIADHKASSQTDPVAIKWSETSMAGRSSVSKLPNGPREELSSDNFTILCADLNGDGRTDIIMPYRTTGDMLSFSVSQSIGTGFKDYITVNTGKPWQPGCKFLALDCDGNGRTDIVQIYKNNNRIAYRVFWSVYDHVNGVTTLDTPVETLTDMSWTDTKEWLVSDIDHNGLQGLIRIFATQRNNESELRAWAFRPSADPGHKGTLTPATDEPVVIGRYTHEEARALTVLTTDINGDGILDLLTCQERISPNGLEIEFIFSSFLNNGQGAFTALGHPVQQKRRFPSGDQPKSRCKFYATSLDGSRYPSVVCVFQQSSTHDWVCLVASGSSDGRVRDLYPPQSASRSSVRIAPAGTLHRSPGKEMDLASMDMNGTGKAGWLLTSNVNDNWSACPVYNTSGVPDLLSSTTNPLGLKVDISYAPMSDPRAYRSPKQWYDGAMPTDPAQREVISSQSLVVSRTLLSNDPLINALPWKQDIIRAYNNAKINLDGRGWQGFETSYMLDVATGVLIEDMFHQTWPLSKVKHQTTSLATKAPKLLVQVDGNAAPTDVFALRNAATTMQCEKLKFEIMPTGANEWDMRTILQSAKEVIQYDAGVPFTVSSGMDWIHDDDGNLISEESWESDAVTTTRSRQVWKKFTYTNIGAAKAMPVSKKVTTVNSNRSPDVFETGDLTLTKITYDKMTPYVTGTAHWSSDHGEFTGETYEHDNFGNRIKSVDCMGLSTTTTYSADFPSCATSTTQEAPGLILTTLSANNVYDLQTAAGRSSTGVLHAVTYDAFGRRSQSMVVATNAADSSTSTTFATDHRCVLDADLAQAFRATPLVCQDRTQYIAIKTKSGKSLLTKVVTKHNSGDDTSAEVSCQAIDCNGRVRISRAQNGAFEPVWMYWDYDSGGSTLSRSTPLYLPKDVEDGFDWTPPAKQCLLSAYDALRRPVLQYRPKSGASKSGQLIKHEYTAGGTQCTSTTRQCDESGVETSAKEISKTVNTFRNVAGRPQVIRTTDESGLNTFMDYDLAGRITSMSDSSNNVESREYNTSGQLLSIDNKYQNTTGKGKAVVFEYNENGQLVKTKNILGETNVLTYDPKGRLLQSIGSDSRVITRTYSSPVNGVSLLQSAAISKPASADLESGYNFNYDQRGRLASSRVTITGTGVYDFTYQYDRQNHLTEKGLPDGSRLLSFYQGSLLSEVRLVSSSGHAVDVTSKYTRYNAYKTAQTSHLSSTALLSQTLNYGSSHDELNTPMERSCGNSSDLASMVYTIGERDQIATITDALTKEVITYTYEKQRLASSQHSESTSNYSYDDSGNITKLGELQLAYSTSSITGVRNGSTSYQANFDGAGRLLSRKVGDAEYSLAYAAGGKLSRIKNLKAGTTTTYLQDAEGNNILCEKSDGSKQVMLGNDFREDVAKDGSSKTTYVTLHGPNGPVAQLRSTSDGVQHLEAYMLDHKGTVTHVYNCHDAKSTKQKFSDYGLSKGEASDTAPGFEAKMREFDSGLICFGGRWYDPIIGRFITPDTVTSISGLAKRDGLNRYAFENNDPVNHVDPTGHWSWDAFAGIVIGIVLVGAAIALSVATAGLASPAGAALAAGGVSALMSAGSTAIFYSIEHINAANNETDHDKFWKGFFSEVAVSAAVGFITGAAGEFLWGAKGVWNLTRVGARSLTPAASAILTDSLNMAIRTVGNTLSSAISSEINKIADNGIEKSFWNPDKDLTDGLRQAAATGALTGAAAHLWGHEFGGKTGAKNAGKFLAGKVSKKVSKVSSTSLYQRLFGEESKSASTLLREARDEVINTRAWRITTDNALNNVPLWHQIIVENYGVATRIPFEADFVRL